MAPNDRLIVAPLPSSATHDALASALREAADKVGVDQALQQSLRLDHDPPAPTFLSIAKCRAVMSAVERWF